MNTLSYKTISIKPAEVVRKWYVFDANGMVLGRIASEVAKILKGKNKTIYTPHVLCGDYVIVLNAKQVKLTGNKWANKEYISYSGYPGGQKRISAEHLIAKIPTAIVERAVKGMLPKNKLGAEMFRSLFVYEGKDHPHEAQKPEAVKL